MPASASATATATRACTPCISCPSIVPNETRFGPDRDSKLDEVSGAASSTTVVLAVVSVLVPGNVATLVPSATSVVA